MSYPKICTVLLGVTLSCTALGDVPSSFYRAKKILADQVYNQHQQSFYCGCAYYSEQRGKRKSLVPDLNSCNYTPRKNAKRAQRIEWEHVVPAWEFGHQLQCWQEGGRKQCRKDKVFRAMEADMFNLVPAIGGVNGDRSNFRFGMLAGEARRYGACDMEIDFKARVAEPEESRRGDVARIYFYMRKTYGLRLSSKQQKLFQTWDKLDPIDQWERERNAHISRLQQVDNPFVY